MASLYIQLFSISNTLKYHFSFFVIFSKNSENQKKILFRILIYSSPESLKFLVLASLHIYYFLCDLSVVIFQFLTFSAENLEFFDLIFRKLEYAKKCPTERKSVLPSANLINRIFRKLYLEYRTLSHSRDTLHLEYPNEKTNPI